MIRFTCDGLITYDFAAVRHEGGGVVTDHSGKKIKLKINKDESSIGEVKIMKTTEIEIKNRKSKIS